MVLMTTRLVMPSWYCACRWLSVCRIWREIRRMVLMYSLPMTRKNGMMIITNSARVRSMMYRKMNAPMNCAQTMMKEGSVSVTRVTMTLTSFSMRLMMSPLWKFLSAAHGVTRAWRKMSICILLLALTLSMAFTQLR